MGRHRFQPQNGSRSARYGSSRRRRSRFSQLERFCDQYIIQTKGRWAGKPLAFEPWQREALTELFVLDDNEEPVYHEEDAGRGVGTGPHPGGQFPRSCLKCGRMEDDPIHRQGDYFTQTVEAAAAYERMYGWLQDR